MSPAMVWEPAEGLAVTRCLAARVRDRAHRTTSDHPSACGWCDYPDEAIAELLDGFNRWAAYEPRSNSYGEHEVRRFYDLPRDVQRERIAAAQCLTGQPWPPRPEPESMQAPTAPPADADPLEGGPSWL